MLRHDGYMTAAHWHAMKHEGAPCPDGLQEDAETSETGPGSKHKTKIV